VLFLDLKKAFDRVSHDALLYMLEKFKFPVQFINTVKAIYGGSRVELIVHGERTKSIPVHRV